MARQTRQKVPFTGLNSVSKRLADGTKVTYWYAWKGGPRLPGQYGSGEFIAAYVEATKGRDGRKTQDGRALLSLLNAYQSSSDFKGLAVRTRTDYIKQIEKIEADFASFPLTALSDQRSRGIFKEWRDRLAEKSKRQADYAFTVLSIILNWGVDRGTIKDNPCQKGGRLYKSERNEAVWTDMDEKAFLATAPIQLHLPFLLGLWTGQREGDILNLTWRNYDGKFIRLRQGKTGARVTVPAGGPLKKILDDLRAERDPGPFDPVCITNRGAHKWSLNGFSTMFKRYSTKAGIVGLTFHDTRGTAVTRLAIAGATVIEIATFTGHSLKDVEQILDSHYLNRDVVMAESALRKLETRTQTPN